MTVGVADAVGVAVALCVAVALGEAESLGASVAVASARDSSVGDAVVVAVTSSTLGEVLTSVLTLFASALLDADALELAVASADRDDVGEGEPEVDGERDPDAVNEGDALASGIEFRSMHSSGSGLTGSVAAAAGIAPAIDVASTATLVTPTTEAARSTRLTLRTDI